MLSEQLRLVIELLPEGVYLATSPDLPGLIVQAQTREQIIALAPEIARDLIEVMRENGEAA